MKIIREVSLQEVLRRFALGEVNSEFYLTPEPSHRAETLRLLNSGEASKEIEGIQRGLASRAIYVNSIPFDTKWHLAELTVSEEEFRRLHVINQQEWVRRSGPLKKLIDAANFLVLNPGTDRRIESIIAALKSKNVEMTGITLFAQQGTGPFTVAEGTARLVAIYITRLKPGLAVADERIEVVLGTSKTSWDFS